MLYKYLLVEIDAEFGQQCCGVNLCDRRSDAGTKKISGGDLKFQITSCNYLVFKMNGRMNDGEAKIISSITK